MAPVGEVVGRVDCRDPDVGENAESVYTLESLINRFDTDGTSIYIAVLQVVNGEINYAPLQRKVKNSQNANELFPFVC